MGWWQTTTGGVIGDGPANIIDEFDEGWTEPEEIPTVVRSRIIACYRKDFERDPTEQELRELLLFANGLGEGLALFRKR